MSSLILSLLAVVAATTPSTEPARPAERPVAAVATVGVRIVPAVRPDWSGIAAGTVLQPSSEMQQSRRIAFRTGPGGEPWYDLEFQ